MQPRNNERINQWVTTSTTDPAGAESVMATQRQSSGRTDERRRDLLRAELKGGESASHAQGYAHAMDGGTNRRTWRGPLRSAKIAKFMKECGKNSKSEEALRRRLRVNPLIEEDSAKLRRRILLLLMPFIPRRDGARWNARSWVGKRRDRTLTRAAAPGRSEEGR